LINKVNFKATQTLENNLSKKEATVVLQKRKEFIISRLDRDSLLVKNIKNMEDYLCQICGRKLINLKSNQPYSEVHHIKPLSHEGTDTIDNVINLCPLCHRLFHLGAIGIDSKNNIIISRKVNETSLKALKNHKNHSISIDSLRYHWITFFINDTDNKFSEDEYFENID
jgi:predicted restriction endonuclease